MSGFDTSWLSLREPADRAARNPVLLRRLAALFAEGGHAPHVMDIGCGTGSTYRTLSARLPQATDWLLVDYDPALLGEASRLIGRPEVKTLQQDLTDLESLTLDGIGLLTASAFFDLCSLSFCEDLAARLAKHNVAIYAALNYDGRIIWTNRHVLDIQIVRSFNRHQATDKGFGEALGPMATPHLKSVFQGLGYEVFTGDSPWRIGPGEEALHRAFVEGMVAPVLEMGDVDRASVESWRDQRLADIDQGGSCLVGHLDLLALPSR
jgi:SAM-dependent methyltransferase